MSFNRKIISFRTLRREGIRYAILRIITKLLGVESDIVRAKKKVLKKIIEEYQYIVAYGPFKGMQLNKDVWWGKLDLISKTLGVYEEDVTQKLTELLQKVKGPFVDIGAADGYFAVGAAYSGLADNVYAFEISEKGRVSLKRSAEINNCLNNIVLRQEANLESLRAVAKDYQEGVALIDIEGGEYDLLSDEVLNALKDFYIIVELHPFKVKEGFEKEKSLIIRAEKYFKLSKIYRKSYSPNRFKELNLFSDDERLLAFSEGRGKNPKWLLMEPRT